jgi:hypothetical protein
MGVSSPTGNGEIRGMEYAGQPGTPLSSRPERAKANNASSVGTHDMDSMYAADGMVDMRDEGKFTPITIPENQHINNEKSGTGDARMGSKVIMEGRPNR